jgi:uncharacterized protein YjlB
MGKVETLALAPGNDVPNSALPVMLYRAALPPGPDLASRFEQRFARNGWRGLWRNGIFAYHHFHDDAHEVLGIAAGHALVQLGGEAGPEVAIEAGDVVVLPAGTGHKRLSSSADLLVIGGYPAGQERPAIKSGGESGPDVAARAAEVPLPTSDPVEGADGALLRAWRAVRSHAG